MAINVSLSDCV